MKYSMVLLIGLAITLATTTAQAQFRKEHTPTHHDSLRQLSVDQLLSPSLQSLPVSNLNSQKVSSDTDLVTFSKTAKFFLQAGADLIRGGSKNIPLYSLENAWKYPGPTVKYPETASEYELFLERYQRYSAEN